MRQPYQELATLCPCLVFLTYRWLVGNTGIRPAYNVVPHSLLTPSQLRVAGCVVKALGCTNGYLEGRGDLVSRLIRGITGVTKWVIGVIRLLTKSSWPSKYLLLINQWGLNPYRQCVYSRMTGPYNPFPGFPTKNRGNFWSSIVTST